MVTKKVPMRQCTGCREMKNKKEMIRVIRTASNRIRSIYHDFNHA